MASDYAARLEIDYPDRDLNRLSTFLRIFYAIPILILLSALTGGSIGGSGDYGGGSIAVTGIGLVVLPVVLMLLFRQKYPRWWFDWNLQMSRFSTRVGAYLTLLNDQYPSTDEEQSVHLELDYPDAENGLSRGMPLIKWLLALPHWIILFILYIAAFFALIGAWFAILFTGRYPRGIFDFVVGVHRWTLRVEAYALMMITDEYPPFSLEP